MDDIEGPLRTGDLVSQLAREPLDSYSHAELNERISLLEAEIVRTVAHRERASAHRLAAEAFFKTPPPDGTGQ